MNKKSQDKKGQIYFKGKKRERASKIMKEVAGLLKIQRKTESSPREK
jgi:hypothetical protein